MPEIPRLGGTVDTASSSAVERIAAINGGNTDCSSRPASVDASLAGCVRRSRTMRARSFDPGASTPWYRSTFAIERLGEAHHGAPALVDDELAGDIGTASPGWLDDGWSSSTMTTWSRVPPSLRLCADPQRLAPHGPPTLALPLDPTTFTASHPARVPAHWTLSCHPQGPRHAAPRPQARHRLSAHARP